MHSCTCYLFVYFIIYLNSLAVAHQIYGVAHTINSANYMYFKALEKVLSLNHPACINIFTGTSTCLMKCRNFSHAVEYDVTSLKNWHIFRQYQWFSGYRCTVFTLDVSATLTLPTLSVLLHLAVQVAQELGFFSVQCHLFFSLSSTCQCWLFTDKCGTYFVHGLVVRNLQALSYNTQSSFSGI